VAAAHGQEDRKQFRHRQGPAHQPETERVVCATDAGREGELIFRLIAEHARCRKPVQRLWISSLTEEAIRAGLAALRPGSDYDPWPPPPAPAPRPTGWWA
jgi:DNA topoisomerase-3